MTQLELPFTDTSKKVFFPMVVSAPGLKPHFKDALMLMFRAWFLTLQNHSE